MNITKLFLTSLCLFFLTSCSSLPAKNTGRPGPSTGQTGLKTINSESNDKKSDSEHRKSDSGDKKSAEGNTKTQVPAERSGADSAHSGPDPSSLSNSLMAWWFMRTKDHSQPSAQEEIDLEKYDAWYVKTNLKPGEKPVFLTFDCGYENGFTPSILDTLKKHKAPAAFFVCKYFIKDQPELIKRMKKEGHIVGNHTANHICMPRASEREIRKEIADNASFMKEQTGYEMDPFFRPPKGEYSERTLQITKDMGYTTVFWSLAYVDYDVDKQPGAGYVIDHFKQYIHPGAIPLIHNISRSNAEALDQVLTDLEKEGYSFHSLIDLI